jgi:hypothetical protein
MHQPHEHRGMVDLLEILITVFTQIFNDHQVEGCSK